MKKGKILGLMAMSAVLLAGCADAMPELTDDESELIAEYAADLLLKYSPNYDYKIAGEQELAEAMELDRLQQASLEAEGATETVPVEETTEIASEGNSEGANNNDNNDGQTPAETESTEVELINDIDADIAELLSIDNVVIRYQSFGLSSSYPEGSAGFSVTAAQGKTLLVVRFDVESAAGGAVECNLFDYNLKISMGVNGRSAQALSTLLPDDIASYMDTIPDGTTKELVAIAEIGEITDEEIESLSLQISNGADRCVLQLR